MKITSIKQQLKNTERVSIFVDGQYSFSLSLDELIKYKLKNDLELEEKDIKRFKKISQDGKLRARSLEWLLNRPHSIREFHDYLYRKKAEPDIIQSLIEEFTNRGYLDEQKFTEWFVELQKRRNKSDRAIRSELFGKGISREVADAILNASENNEENRLKALIEKKQKLSRYKSDPKKMAQYLVNQGFSWLDVKEALSNREPDK